MVGISVRDRSARAAKANARLNLERLEDRCLLHTGVALFTAGLTPNAGLTGIVQGPDNNFWFTEFGANRIGRTTRTGTITEFILPAGRGPLNITLGPREQALVHVQQRRHDRPHRPAGRQRCGHSEFAHRVRRPWRRQRRRTISRLVPDSALWFTETGSAEIGRITTAGVVTEFPLPGAGSAPAGITAGSDGALWFTEAGSGKIGRMTTAGAVTEFVIPVPTNAVSESRRHHRRTGRFPVLH